MKVVYTDEALRDLDEITLWLKANYPGTGTAVERRLRLVVAHIARWPESMRVSAHRPGVRVATLGRYPYKIFYRVRGNAVEILHVHHAARELGRTAVRQLQRMPWRFATTSIPPRTSRPIAPRAAPLRRKPMMLRIVSTVLALSCALAPPALAASAHKHVTHKRVVHKKRHISRHWHGYGFLPGYVPPEVAARERRYREEGPHFYGPAWPGFYHGRWNGGGFGPCWTYTPIGYMWNCGK